MDIGNEIRRLVNSNPEKYSAEGFAKLLGRKHKQTFYDRTKKNDFTISELERIAQWLDVPASHFFPKEKNMQVSEPATEYGKMFIEQRVELLEKECREVKRQLEGLVQILKNYEKLPNKEEEKTEKPYEQQSTGKKK